MCVWQGVVRTEKDQILEDVRFVHLQLEDNDDVLYSIHGQSLDVLGVIDATRIPFSLLIGKHLRLESDNLETRTWLAEALQGDEDLEFHTPAAILLKVTEAGNLRPLTTEPRVTEVVVYGARAGTIESKDKLSVPAENWLVNGIRLVGDESKEESNAKHGPIILYALRLSSDLVYADDVPPLQILPIAEEVATSAGASANPSKKDRLTQLFEEAKHPRKRPRLSDGPEVARTGSRASSVSSPLMPQDGFSIDNLTTKNREVLLSSGTDLEGEPAVTRPSFGQLKSPSLISEIRPASRRGTFERTNTLLSKSFNADTMLEQQIETRNKEVISRTVLTGMRMYGLQQYKSASKTKARNNSGNQTLNDSQELPVDDVEMQEVPDGAGDAEYKAVYHQANKGTIFAFRKSMGSTMLKTETIKDIVDRLLAVFCVDPP